MQSKQWWTSWTLWVNGSLAVLAALDLLQANPAIPKEWLPHIATASAIITILLRVFRTNAPIAIGSANGNVPVKLAVFAAIIGLSISLSGCANFEQNAYKTLGAVGATENAAVRVFKNYSASTGNTNTSEIATVRDLHEKFVASYTLTVDALVEYHEAQIKNTAPVIAALSALSAMFQDVINVTCLFLPPPQAAQLRRIAP